MDDQPSIYWRRNLENAAARSIDDQPWNYWWEGKDGCYNISMPSWTTIDAQGRGGGVCIHEIIWGGWAIPWNTNDGYLRGGSYEWQLQCTHEIIWGGWAIPWNTNHEYLSGLVEGLMNGNHNVHPWNHFEWVELSMDVQSWIPWGRGLMNGNYNGSMGNHGYICSTQYLTCR